MVDPQLPGGGDETVVAVDGEVAERVRARAAEGTSASAQPAVNTAAQEANRRRGSLGRLQRLERRTGLAGAQRRRSRG